VVELIGIPGSGKTYISGLLKNEFNYHQIKVFDRDNPYYINFKANDISRNKYPFFFSKNYQAYQLIAKGVDHIFQIRSKYYDKFGKQNKNLILFVDEIIKNEIRLLNHRRLVEKWFANVAAIYQMAICSKNQNFIVLFDEGFIQKVISLFASYETSQINYEQIKTYLDLIPLPDVLFSIHAPISICKDRIFTRGLPRRLTGQSEKNIVKYLETTEKMFNYVIQYLREMGIKIIHVNNFELTPPIFLLSDELITFFKHA